jgi:hypothetical protein
MVRFKKTNGKVQKKSVGYSQGSAGLDDFSDQGLIEDHGVSI